FRFEVWSTGSGWGSMATQTIAAAALQQLRRTPHLRTHAKLWRREGWLNTRSHRAGWFSKDLILPASSAGAVLVADALAIASSAAALITSIPLSAAAGCKASTSAALTTAIPLAAAACGKTST